VDRECALNQTHQLPSWCEIDLSALRSNIMQLASRLSPGCRLGAVVKADAYGHGLVPCARAALDAGADLLIVNDLSEACVLRDEGLTAQIYVCGPVLRSQAALAVTCGVSLVVHDAGLVESLAQAAVARGRQVPLHLKVETGTHRQGIAIDDVVEFARQVSNRDGVQLEGLTTHFADLEDSQDRLFARQQLACLQDARQRLIEAGYDVPSTHAASSAAALLLPEAQLDMVRAGLAIYGLWPSAAMAMELSGHLELSPVLSWRARVFPGVAVEAGQSVGYGRTYHVGAGPARRQAVLNVGYHEGFDRRRSNTGHVLVAGQRAPIRGRICMNMSMVEPPSEVGPGTVATLIGRDGEQEISADHFAAWTASINYEIISRIHPRIPRIYV
jgi:alanine racemase